METLDWRYVGREHDRIQLNANLLQGWKDLSKPNNRYNYWGFDESVKAEYRMSSYFRCHLYVVAVAPHSWSSVHCAPEVQFSGTLGRNSVNVDGFTMNVDVPLTQEWRPNKQGRPLIYEISDRLFQTATPDGNVGYRVQLWVVHHGDDKMFVRSEHEWGDGFAWVGGRPESNRRKF